MTMQTMYINTNQPLFFFLVVKPTRFGEFMQLEIKLEENETLEGILVITIPIDIII